MTTKYAKWPKSIPNGRKIFLMATNIPTCSIPRTNKLNPDGDFGMKIRQPWPVTE
jgi:hypothetical protein